jgi:phenylpyruvate tautomerase PptA (4-oxalocrotonate tautomerase family)
MPVITIKVFEGELTLGQTAKLVDHITEAVVPFVGNAIRSSVWLLVEKATTKQNASAHETFVNRKVCTISPRSREEQNGGRRP